MNCFAVFFFYALLSLLIIEEGIQKFGNGLLDRPEICLCQKVGTYVPCLKDENYMSTKLEKMNWSAGNILDTRYLIRPSQLQLKGKENNCRRNYEVYHFLSG